MAQVFRLKCAPKGFIPLTTTSSSTWAYLLNNYKCRIHSACSQASKHSSNLFIGVHRYTLSHPHYQYCSLNVAYAQLMPRQSRCPLAALNTTSVTIQRFPILCAHSHTHTHRQTPPPPHISPPEMYQAFYREFLKIVFQLKNFFGFYGCAKLRAECGMKKVRWCVTVATWQNHLLFQFISHSISFGIPCGKTSQTFILVLSFQEGTFQIL